LRPTLEGLEGRTVPSTFNAATASDLIADLNAANRAGGSNAITLAPNVTFDLTVVNNTTDGATGLPVIAGKDNLTIIGQGGDIIQRDPAAPAFRLLDVGKGASLTLQNLTLQGGDAFGSGVSAEGGGIYNQGLLILNGATIQNNVAQGGSLVTQVTHKNSSAANGPSAAGGGIYSSGTLTLEGGTIVQGNKAIGGQGWVPGGRSGAVGVNGGNGSGGGLYVASGTATLESGTLVQGNIAVGGSGESALGGHGGNGGNGFGGGLYVAGGTVTLTSTTLSSNYTQGGAGGGATGPTPLNGREASGTPGVGGSGYGGGLYATGGTISLVDDTVGSNNASQGGGLDITNSAKVSLDAFTLAHTTSNSGGDIYGSYTLL
jgi:hypothetical protein